MRIAVPAFLGRRVLRDFPLAEIAAYIDWSPFFMAWEMTGKYPAIFDDPGGRRGGPQAVRRRPRRLLRRIVRGRQPAARPRRCTASGRRTATATTSSSSPTRRGRRNGCASTRCASNGSARGRRRFRSLADYIAPVGERPGRLSRRLRRHGRRRRDELVGEFEAEHDDYNAIMTKALADRLAEAFAELLHQRARRDWGYGREEHLSKDELIAEKYRGIRPAAGYPACPDHTEKATLWRLLDAEAGDGHPADGELRHDGRRASVSGLYFAHPGGDVFRRRSDHARSGGGLRAAEADATRGGGALAWRRTWRMRRNKGSPPDSFRQAVVGGRGLAGACPVRTSV